MPDEVIRSVKMNRNIRLDSRLITHIAHKSSDYESWGILYSAPIKIGLIIGIYIYLSIIYIYLKINILYND